VAVRESAHPDVLNLYVQEGRTNGVQRKAYGKKLTENPTGFDAKEFMRRPDDKANKPDVRARRAPLRPTQESLGNLSDKRTR